MSDLLFDFIQHSSPNALGGEDLFDGNGIQIGWTTPNALGGQDVFDTDGTLVAHTADNVEGGQDIFDEHGHEIASTYPTASGALLQDAQGATVGQFVESGSTITFHDFRGHYVSWYENIFGGMTADPLTNMRALTFPSFVGVS